MSGMRVPLCFRPSSLSFSGDLLVKLREKECYKARPDATLCQTIGHVAQRTFDMLRVWLTASLDLMWFFAELRSYVPHPGQTLINTVATLALPILSFGMPFGYIPKVHYLRGDGFNNPNLPSSPNPILQSTPYGFIERNPVIIDIINRADEYENIAELKKQINTHLNKIEATIPVPPGMQDPAYATTFINDIQSQLDGILLAIAYSNSLFPLMRRILHMGISINSPVITYLRADESILERAIRLHDSTLVTFLLSQNADATRELNGVKVIDKALFSQTLNFPDPNAYFYRFRSWYANKRICNIAKQLMRAGATIDRTEYTTLCTDLAQSNFGGITPLAQHTQALRGIVPTAMRDLKIRNYAINLRDHILPQLR